MAITPVGFPTIATSRLREMGDAARPQVESPARGNQAAGGTSFTDVIENLLAKANEPQLQADQAFQQLATGQSNNVHDVVMSAVKADLSFRLVLEMRNRLTEAYQEIMRMQV